MNWQPIESAPPNTDLLVYVRYEIGRDDFVSDMWVDWFSEEKGRRSWFSYPQLIHIPFPPTLWTYPPEPPEETA